MSLVADRTMWLWKVFAGIIGILAGIAVIQHPMWATILVPSTLILVVGIFGIVSGILGIIHSWSARSWIGVALGAFGALLGLILVMNPVIGAATLPFVVGIFALIGGIMSLVAAWSERQSQRRLAAAGSPDLTTPAAWIGPRARTRVARARGGGLRAPLPGAIMGRTLPASGLPSHGPGRVPDRG